MWTSDNTNSKPFREPFFGAKFNKEEYLEIIMGAAKLISTQLNIDEVNNQTDEEQEADIGYYLKQRRHEDTCPRHSY